MGFHGYASNECVDPDCIKLGRHCHPYQSPLNSPPLRSSLDGPQRVIPFLPIKKYRSQPSLGAGSGVDLSKTFKSTSHGTWRFGEKNVKAKNLSEKQKVSLDSAYTNDPQPQSRPASPQSVNETVRLERSSSRASENGDSIWTGSDCSTPDEVSTSASSTELVNLLEEFAITDEGGAEEDDTIEELRQSGQTKTLMVAPKEFMEEALKRHFHLPDACPPRVRKVNGSMQQQSASMSLARWAHHKKLWIITSRRLTSLKLAKVIDTSVAPEIFESEYDREVNPFFT
ncbi:hypothetical protein G7Y89_g5454 [Cudoniella acicularis]|uniref:Uncharacterized protein n=1 Tax=Cudoniella acicularis TaxID=354080 RepID=A0A8H4W3S5_9HELO|nr:hypothetical protein G7Y89_g5454 [Cudoniella acicularis]